MLYINLSFFLKYFRFLQFPNQEMSVSNGSKTIFKTMFLNAKRYHLLLLSFSLHFPLSLTRSLSPLFQNPQCSNRDEYNIAWRWDDLYNDELKRKELPITHLSLVNPETEGKLFGPPMSKKFYDGSFSFPPSSPLPSSPPSLSTSFPPPFPLEKEDAVYGRHKLFHVAFDSAILYGRGEFRFIFLYLYLHV